VPYVAAAVAGVAGVSRMAAARRRMDRRASVVAVALVVVVVALVLTVVGGFRPAGGVEGASDAPSDVANGGSGHSPPPSPSGASTANIETSAEPTTVLIAATPSPPGTATQGPDVAGTSQPTPKPAAAPTPRPRATVSPTPKPTPKPTPAPKPTPVPKPTPGCMTVPSLVGLTVQNARAAWKAAGFTGSFSPAHGQNDLIVQTQSQTPGVCLPATTTIVVTFA